jgi:hypothetical protein
MPGLFCHARPDCRAAVSLHCRLYACVAGTGQQLDEIRQPLRAPDLNLHQISASLCVVIWCFSVLWYCHIFFPKIEVLFSSQRIIKASRACFDTCSSVSRRAKIRGFGCPRKTFGPHNTLLKAAKTWFDRHARFGCETALASAT